MFGSAKDLLKVYEKAKQDLGVFLKTQGEEYIKGKKLVIKPKYGKDGFQVEFSLEDK